MSIPTEACPHVTAPMIAAGFTLCAMCEKDGPPPPAGFTVDDTARQEARVKDSYRDLAGALNTLAVEAETAAKACMRKRPAPDMDRVHAARRAMERAAEDVDVAVHDLHTARGGHG